MDREELTKYLIEKFADKIEALESGAEGGEERRGTPEDDPLARQILDSAARLVDRHPDRLRELSQLLVALDEIMGGRQP